MNDNSEEKELLLRLHCSDERALSKLMDDYFIPLCDFCNVFIGNMAVSEELVADVFYTIWNKRKALKIHTSLKSYLYIAVRNKALQKKRNLGTSTLTSIDSTTSDVVDPHNALGHLMLREFSDDIEKLIKELPEKRRIIFELNRFESFTYKEISALLQISEKTVHNQISLAIKHLRTRVNLLLDKQS